jgi:hypothetical protein
MAQVDGNARRTSQDVLSRGLRHHGRPWLPPVDHAGGTTRSAEAATSCHFVDARRRLDPASGAGWQDVDGARAIYDGPGSPLNQSFGLGMLTDVRDETLAAIEAFFSERGVPSEHEVSPLALGDALVVLSRRGYEPFELTNVLFQPTAGARHWRARPASTSA